MLVLHAPTPNMKDIGSGGEEDDVKPQDGLNSLDDGDATNGIRAKDYAEEEGAGGKDQPISIPSSPVAPAPSTTRKRAHSPSPSPFMNVDGPAPSANAINADQDMAAPDANEDDDPEIVDEPLRSPSPAPPPKKAARTKTGRSAAASARKKLKEDEDEDDGGDEDEEFKPSTPKRPTRAAKQTGAVEGSAVGTRRSGRVTRSSAR